MRKMIFFWSWSTSNKKNFIFGQNNVQTFSKKFFEQICLFPAIIWGSESNSRKMVKNRSKIGQILPKTNIFEVGQLFWKKKLFLKTITLKDSPKIFLKIFGHFRPKYRTFILELFFPIFCDFLQKWPIRPADRPIRPISKVPARDALFKKIYNLAQFLIVPEISSFSFSPPRAQMVPIRKKPGTPFKL